MPASFKNNKLTATGFKRWALNTFTPTKASWNGHNASGWLSDILAVNGFDERMQYGGQDREFGELWNSWYADTLLYRMPPFGSCKRV